MSTRRAGWLHRRAKVAGAALILSAAATCAIGGAADPAAACGARAAALDLGTLGGAASEAVAVDGGGVVGWAERVGGSRHAFAYDVGAPSPAMVDLGTLGGAASEAVAVDGGVVVGWAETVGGSRHAFAYDVGAPSPAMVDLGTLGGTTSSAADVDGRVVVGTSATGQTFARGFAYDLDAPSAGMIDLGPEYGGSGAGQIDGSLIVGSVRVGLGRYQGFFYDLAAETPMLRYVGTLGGPQASAWDVSGSLVVGDSTTSWLFSTPHAYVADVSTAVSSLAVRPRDLGTLGGATSVARAVSGQLIVGEAATATNEGHAFAVDLADPAAPMVDLGTLGGSSSTAVEVDGDMIVGDSSTASGETHAFVVDWGSAPLSMVDLGTLGGTESHARAVSGRVVVGRSTTAGGASRAVVWNREPSGGTPAVQLTQLEQRLRAAGHPGLANQVRTAARHLARGRGAVAQQLLQTTIRQLRHLSGRQVPEALARELIRSAERIGAAIRC
jgi:probable HAF family extracellular repeat protein